MPAQRSVGRFCSLITKDLTSLATLDAADLGTGAQAYVVSTRRSYRLDLSSSFGNFSPLSIAALGGGTWFQEGPVKDQAAFQESVTTSNDNTLTVNTWRALPSQGGLYSLVTPTSTGWDSNTTTGIFTYSGPPRTFLVTGVFCVQLLDHADTWEFDLSQNGTFIGGTTSFPSSVQSAANNTGLIFATHSYVIAMVAGLTLQHIIRQITGTGGFFNLVKYQAFCELLP